MLVSFICVCRVRCAALCKRLGGGTVSACPVSVQIMPGACLEHTTSHRHARAGSMHFRGHNFGAKG
jgi:hypothetical protein